MMCKKKEFLRTIINFIKKNNINDYNEVVNYVMSNDFLLSYLKKRKDIAIYLQRLKYDRIFKKELEKNNLFIIRNKICDIKEKNTTNRKRNEFSDILKQITQKDVEKYNTPYNYIIQTFKDGRKNKERLDKYTNERTFNFILNNFYDSVIKFIDYIKKLKHKFVNVKLVCNNGSVSLICYLNDNILFSIKISKTKYISLEYIDSELSYYINQLCKIYPFSHLEYSNYIMLSYILYVKKYIRETKFIFYQILNIIAEYSKSKFNLNSLGLDVVNGRLSKIINDDVRLLNSLFAYFIDKSVIFSEYVVALYKFLVYEKNKLIRECKNMNLNNNIFGHYTKEVPLEYLDNCLYDKFYSRKRDI